MNNETKSNEERKYGERPPYADFDAPAKFTAIQSIIGKHLRNHPNAICSYSGGSDSDIMIDLIERARDLFDLPPIKYAFFNTGLEMQATKDHVQATAEKYGVDIEELRPEINIVQATRKYGIPFVSKMFSAEMYYIQKKGIPLTIAKEFFEAEDKKRKIEELYDRYPQSVAEVDFICCCTRDGREIEQWNQSCIDSKKYMRDFIAEHPPQFLISSKCCNYCKKKPAHKIQSAYEMIITGERAAEGGVRAMLSAGKTGCFNENQYGQFRLRPLFYVNDDDKAWYKEHYNIRYSDAYEVYGLTRTGCCGCSISYKAEEDLAKIAPYEPNVVKAAYNIFGASYAYRRQYNEYKARRKAEEKAKMDDGSVQMSLL